MTRKKFFVDLPVSKETREIVKELKGTDTYDTFLKKFSKEYKKHSKRFEF